MPEPFLRPFSSSRDSWFRRIRENLQQVLASARIFPSSANGAPLHLVPSRPPAVASRSRTISLLAHLLLICGVLFLHLQSGPPRGHAGPKASLDRLRTFFPPPDPSLFAQPSLGMKSGGGEKDPRPARRGELAPGSSRPLLPPRAVVNPVPELPVPASVFEANASALPPVITNLGLPWMKEDSNSAGPGKGHGFGAGGKGGMGDDEGPGAGQGDSYNVYSNGVTLPTCVYCPEPQYTDQAREAKLAGRVTLRVLVGADGRAWQVQIVQRVGLGLDERAVESVRAWKFSPAHDAARRAVASWVTIEVVFRLI